MHHDATQLRTIHPSITLANNIVSFTHLLHTISILLIHRSFYRVCMAMLVARTLFARLLFELRSRACFFSLVGVAAVVVHTYPICVFSVRNCMQMQTKPMPISNVACIRL